MKLINLTPHTINLANEAGEILMTIEPSGIIARLVVTPGMLEEVPGLPVPVASPPQYGEIEGLPDPQTGVLYVASYIVASRAGRPDVLQPGTGPRDGAIRDDAGRIVAVTRLVRHA